MSTSEASSGFSPLGSTKHRDSLRLDWMVQGATAFILLLMLFVLMGITGCGTGGYAGGGIVSLSATTATIDAGQTFAVNSTLSQNPTVTWSLQSGGCSGKGCGMLSNMESTSASYTAPSGIVAPFKVNLIAAVAGTQNSKTVAITVNPDPVITANLPGGTVGVPYLATATVAGGTPPFKWMAPVGALPAGLSFNTTTGVISGTPTATGSSSFLIQGTDSSDIPYTTSLQAAIVVSTPIPTLTVIGGNPPSGTVGVTYATSLQATGGTLPYSWSIVSGSLPAGLSISSSTGIISGTPTAAGISIFTAQAQDANGMKASGVFSITINSAVTPLTLTITSLPNGTVGVAYLATIGVSGGTAPYACSITSGTLPAGLSLSGCTVSGTPTTAGISNLIVKATDSSNPTLTVSGPVSITITAATTPLALTITSLPNGTVNVAYSATIGVSGGTAPYSCSITSGTLPLGLMLTGCVVSGVPTTAGVSNLMVKATDSSNPTLTVSGPVSITIVAAPIPLTLIPTLPSGTVGVSYTATIGVSGGAAPYSCTITGSLPAGLTQNGCVISGTPTAAGTASLPVKATDSSAPVQSVTGTVGLTINPAGAPLTLTLTSLPDGTVGVAYSAMIGVSGGTAPYSCTITSGSLPAGLSLAGCTVSGTPTTAGTSSLIVKATDTSNPTQTISGPMSITIDPAVVLVITSPPAATVNLPYTGTIGVTGGTGPYSCTISSGTLPAGLTLTGCVVSGTPTTAGTSNLTVTTTDAGNPAHKATGPVTIVVSPAPLVLTLTSLPDGTVGTAYSQTIGVSGGTAPYSCTITSGTLPTGLTLNGCVVSGTPSVAGTSNLIVKATDSSATVETVTGPVSLKINPASLVLTLTSLPDGTVGVAYSQTIGVSGGTAPYSCTITSGTLPTGLTLNGCVVSGTPTVSGSSNVIVKATDSSTTVETVTGPVSLKINPAALTLTLMSLPDGTVGVAYSQTIGVSGGTAPYSCTITSGTLPGGLSLSGCVVSGTPTVAGMSNLIVKATDSSTTVETVTGPVSLKINPAALALTLTSLPDGTVGTPYLQTIGVSGGTAPYSCTITSGVLPTGLSLNGCVVSGTPATSGLSNLIVKATDSSATVETVTGPVSLKINPAPLVLTLTSLPDGTVGIAYSQTIGVSGGTAPYSCTITSGTLPGGLSLSGCVVSGTPTTSGLSNLIVKATDSSATVETVTGPVSLKINPAPLVLTLTSLPDGIVGVAYSQTIGVSGGTSPYSCTITSGALPTGLTLNGCVVSGTPTVSGSSNLIVKATDSSATVETVTGPVSLKINPAPLVLTLTSLPDGTVGTPYSQTIGVSGGTSPYSCTITSGALPTGLTLNGCVVSGTPTVAGTSNLVVKATDSSTTVETVTGPVSLKIDPAPLALTLTSLPDGTVGVTYSQTIGVSGGTAPYSCTITSGALPGGLSLSGCVVSGTPTVAGTSNLIVKATDSSAVTETTTGPVSLKINPAPVVLTLGNPPNGTVGVVYTGSIGVTGGTAPYSCTLVSGSVPAGLTLTGCALTGTPTTAQAPTFIVKATDSSSPVATQTGPVTVTIVAPAATLTITSPPPATAGQPYTGPIGITGGTGPYTCTLISGTLPLGLSLNNCTVTGTTTTTGSTPIVVKVTDSGNPSTTTTGTVTIVVNPVAKLTLTGSVPNAVLGMPYTQTLTAAGGITPYSYAVTAGALPAGLSLSKGGVISGTPTMVGASSFTVTVTDTETTPQTASLPLVLLVTYPTTPNDSILKGPYAFLFQGYDDAVAGVLAYQTATVGSFTADGTGVLSSGELDANHQSSTATGNTIVSNGFLGTYQVNTDDRGFITITTLNADGTTAATSTYAIALKAPVSPATTTAQGSLIEADNDQLAGTKGTGSLLAQNAAAVTAGLTGNYAFGLEGDTACPISCAVGVLGGPAASVGEFAATSSGSTVAGTGDANVSATTYASKALAGSYGVADANGRVQLSMLTAGVPTNYPTDYAVYVVDANNAFVMSTDKHSAFILLSGSAQARTQTAFSNASMTNAFIGYENAATNPGLVTGLVLQNVLNFSTATIFRETATADGNCSVSSVDIGGLDSLVSGLTGILGSLTGLDTILGTYATTGAATCAVSSIGRGSLQYPQEYGLLGIPVGTPPAPRIVYLSAPDRGYFLETGYAGLGNIEPQTGAPYSAATFKGTYIYGEPAAGSAASIDTTGTITADGAGHATSTTDSNIGVGTINVLQLGVSSAATYTTPDTTTGRFVLNGTVVIYTIAPGRFVSVDTNKLTTSPAINLLY